METIRRECVEGGEPCSLEGRAWMFGLRGVLAVLFGTAAVVMPVAALLAMTLAFGVFAMLDGALLLASGLRRERGAWGPLVAAGVLGLATGLIVLVAPRVAALGIAFFLWVAIASWAILSGILELAASRRLRREAGGERLLGFRGALNLGLGVAMLALLVRDPGATLATMGLLVGTGAILSGILLLMLAVRLHRLQRRASVHA